MVVDEELKMMCALCTEGGQVLGPFLKPMSRLVHTEYLLAGRTTRDPRDVLRDTMYAATVTGSPVENACRLIKRYESRGRGYYGAALAVLGRDASGGPVVDSPIVIRTADVDLDGHLTVTAGATLVRDSDAADEVAETHAKAGGILSAFGLVPPAPVPSVNVAELVNDEDVLLVLNARNRRLSTFWLTDQAGVIRHDAYDAERDRPVLDAADLVIVGPGPGDPRDADDPKMRTMRTVVDRLLARGQPFLAVCLGHQVLCQRLGIDLGFKDIVFQGTQSPVGIDGRTERVGFYNTFVGRAGGPLPDGVEVEADPESGDIHLIRGPHFRGIQFHAESILTEHGYDLIHNLVRELVTARP